MTKGYSILADGPRVLRHIDKLCGSWPTTKEQNMLALMFFGYIFFSITIFFCYFKFLRPRFARSPARAFEKAFLFALFFSPGLFASGHSGMILPASTGLFFTVLEGRYDFELVSINLGSIAVTSTIGLLFLWFTKKLRTNNKNQGNTK